ncbi:D-alanyl-D-alanine carboxypeptidase/D-alanyl-D-alanine endopeptidase [Sphingobacterium bovistauri]|uniref:D-alanyl-D-alanine carboxypeptidase/D-alanyl-D-alanine-endopeptidase n=1 Tax=Sphingobacterium bovistauri TaxID=2781959 RepID=A0ABS7Z1B7_9SPHI|nr:D-alanyl-D-alanine carboxypeptidase/D-alanyl-D-alanine-endopeptidase [Sphingobacterium bovistauri]MCA5003958.1 D-alanyl-D-alanine carboxypeptidase/D-alanyl-D-alanine-endopeptidase [Sphingobacterium bovistauri]
MKIHSLLIAGLLGFVATNDLHAQNIKQKLEQNFITFSNHSSLTNGMYSLHVINAENGETVFEKNANTGLPTASTLKVITSITALDLLGKDFTYKTKLYYSGEIDSLGTLHGDIVIHGEGDPTLGSHRYPTSNPDVILTKWKKVILDAGIKSINGRLIADDRMYNGIDVPVGWTWGDIGNYYGAGISSLNWRENSFGVNFQAGNIQEPALIVNTTADISYLKLINHVKIGAKGSGDNVYGYAAPYSEKIIMKGTYAQDLKKTIEFSLPDPAYDLAFRLSKELATDSIFIANEITTGQKLVEKGLPVPIETKLLNIHVSPPLHEIIHWFNKRSINLYGEAILKSIAVLSGGKTSTIDGARFLTKYWEQKLNIKSSELDIVDGSGLSPQNNVTTKAMNQIMQYALKRPWFNEFNNSLPVYNGMTMKSGTINGTLGYTGYHTAKDGKKYTFSLLVYNYDSSGSQMRQRMFTLLNTLK